MRIPRMNVRRLMLLVLVFALGYWTVETAARRESYRLKFSRYARREKQIRSFHESWTEVVTRADKLLKSDKGDREPEEIAGLEEFLDNIYDRYTCSAIDCVFIPSAEPAGDPANQDARLVHEIDVARQNLAILAPLLAYQEKMRRKYELAMARPWRPALLDPSE
jgi:hypothetical protein